MPRAPGSVSSSHQPSPHSLTTYTWMNPSATSPDQAM